MSTENMSLEAFRRLQKTMLRKPVKKRAPSEGEETLAQQLTDRKIPFEREFRFCPGRLWRFDFILTNTNYAIEVEGGVWAKHTKSRHMTGSGWEADAIKYAEAALLGYRVLRFSTPQVKRGIAIAFALRATK